MLQILFVKKNNHIIDLTCAVTIKNIIRFSFFLFNLFQTMMITIIGTCPHACMFTHTCSELMPVCVYRLAHVLLGVGVFHMERAEFSRPAHLTEFTLDVCVKRSVKRIKCMVGMGVDGQTPIHAYTHTCRDISLL